VWVERLVQGDRTKRKKLSEGPWTAEKFIKLSITHVIWLVIAWCTAGSFVLYFNDAPTLVRSFLNFDVSPTVLGFVGGLTFMTYLMAGFAREQVCTFMCPYARFQSAMFGKDTLVIGYDPQRGEPRGHHKKGEPWDNRGHCIDCTACVQVCPMGIDIRDGLQMECIACGLCIDACDEVMTKIDLPKGLIRYDTERRLDEKVKGEPLTPIKLIRPRTVYYIAVLCLVGGLMAYAFAARSVLDLNVLHDRNPLFVQLSDGNIRNGYNIKILNKTHEPRAYSLSVSGLENAHITLNTAGDVAADRITVKANSVGQFKVFVHAPIDPQAPKDITLMIEDLETGAKTEQKTMFISERPHG